MSDGDALTGVQTCTVTAIDSIDTNQLARTSIRNECRATSKDQILSFHENHTSVVFMTM